MNQNEENQDEKSVFPVFIISLTDDRGQTHFCPKLTAKLFERGESPCTREFPESHPLFLNIPTEISSQAICTKFIHKDYVKFKVSPLTFDAKPLNNNSSFLPDRIGSNSLNSTLIQ